jgi:hypothetical protein
MNASSIGWDNVIASSCLPGEKICDHLNEEAGEESNTP